MSVNALAFHTNRHRRLLQWTAVVSCLLATPAKAEEAAILHCKTTAQTGGGEALQEDFVLVDLPNKIAISKFYLGMDNNAKKLAELSQTDLRNEYNQYTEQFGDAEIIFRVEDNQLKPAIVGNTKRDHVVTTIIRMSIDRISGDFTRTEHGLEWAGKSPEGIDVYEVGYKIFRSSNGRCQRAEPVI